MAIATTATFDLDLRGIARNGMRIAGILSETDEPTGPEVTMCGEFVNLQLKAWQLAGRMLRNVARTTVPIDATARSTGVLTVASDTIDIEFPMALKLTSGDQTYEVERVSQKDFLLISNKTETGIPTMALIERAATVSMRLWPIPDSTVSTIEYSRVFLIKDAKASNTLDVHQRCLQAVVLGLAVDLAEWAGKDDAKLSRLQLRYSNAQNAVFRDNTERGGIKFSLR